MKRKDSAFIIICAVLSIFMAVSTVILPHKSFSEKENRPLAQAPALNISQISSGKYFESLSAFLKDQIPFRNAFVSLRSICELSLGKTEVNGVTVADGALIALPERLDKNRITNNIASLRGLCKSRSILYVPPRSIDVFCDSLPALYYYNEQTDVLSALDEKTLSLFTDFLESASKDTYYKTDHHWTSSGAYYAYTQICKELQISPYGEEYFTKETVTNDFRGSAYSRSGLPSFAVDGDKIILYRYPSDLSAKTVYHEKNETKKGFYDLEAINRSDKYSVFLGGNYAHLSIELPSSEKKPSLLLIKDSFANSVVPFLALNYNIEMIDPRYCTNSFLKKCLQSNAYDKALFLLSLDTLAQISV